MCPPEEESQRGFDMKDESRLDGMSTCATPEGNERARSEATPELPARRQFIQASLLGGVAAVTLTVRPSRGAFLNISPAREAKSSATSFELDEMTVTELQDGMSSGRFTAHSITEKYIARIEAIDKHGPAVNSVIELNPDALAIAKALDKERKQKRHRGPLHGIPVLIKDNIDTSDRMMTTAGSLALVGSRPPKDSMVAQKLREAGAVILGKTNLSEWANIRSNQSTSGWSGRAPGLGEHNHLLEKLEKTDQEKP
jgi:amidase